MEIGRADERKRDGRRIGLRIHAARLLERAVHAPAEQMDRDEVQEDRRQHFRCIAPDAEERRDRRPECAGEERSDQCGRDSVRRCDERRERAGDELSFAADIPDAGAERDDDRESRQQQRDRLQERPFEREWGTDRAADEDRKKIAMAEEGADRRQDSDRDRRRGNAEGDPLQCSPAISFATRSAATAGVMRSLRTPR